ncbi:hypothetical protein CkaCkLH20_04280 [Colletotrichum karsti]|uniref:Uncharacterized protein n=1 Tax=Colletotrichum karsti TaxID=1095194 RepID=A0A9P6I9I1_9PEZI|nr:uncharacterized protein CkaCkLH20_04280 [Colletotrichum karsti]KAF9878242.1 hypothetical protein CkaCkLH20_04280 [Colletotrichum karsti]
MSRSTPKQSIGYQISRSKMETFGISCVANACSFTTPGPLLQRNNSALMSEMRLHSTTPGWTEISNITTGFPDGAEIHLNFNRPGGFDSMFHVDSAAPTADELVSVTFEATCTGANCDKLPQTAVLPAVGKMRLDKTIVHNIIANPSLVPYAQHCLYSPTTESMKACSLFAPLWGAVEEEWHSSVPDSDVDEVDDSTYETLVARGVFIKALFGPLADLVMEVIIVEVVAALKRHHKKHRNTKRTLEDSHINSPNINGPREFSTSQEIAKGTRQFAGEYISGFMGIIAPQLTQVLFPPGWNDDGAEFSFITVDEFYLMDTTSPVILDDSDK